MQSQILSEFYKEQNKTRFNQGDILKNIVVSSQGVDEETKEGLVIQTVLDFAVVINQDCDLEQDFNAKIPGNTKLDKYLPNIILLPAYLDESFKAGTHRENIKSEVWQANLYKDIAKNKHLRFHFIQQNQEFQIPNLVIDFKHLYTLNRDFLYYNIDSVYLVSICELFRESLSHRHSYYLSRIGLPDRET